MRLLMTTDTVGGVWTFTKELATGLLERGCELVLVSFGRAPSREQQDDVKALTSRGMFQYIADDTPLEWMPKNNLAYQAAESLLLKLCRNFQPDSLLLSQYCFGALPVTVPKALIAHSDVLSWSVAVGKVPLHEDLWLQTYRRMVQGGLDGADLLIAPTRATMECMAAHFRLPGETAVIPNGRTVEVPIGSKQLRAITAGRMWDPAKNLSLLNRVAAPMPILVAGEQHDDNTATPCVLLGQQSATELLKLFSESAIYVCCSTYEPFGLAPVEAALCGCAIVANDIPTLREVWGEAALYFSGPKHLGQILQTLKQDPEHLAAAQQRSMQRAQGYSTARMTEGYLKQLKTLVTTRARSEARAA